MWIVCLFALHYQTDTVLASVNYHFATQIADWRNHATILPLPMVVLQPQQQALRALPLAEPASATAMAQQQALRAFPLSQQAPMAALHPQQQALRALPVAEPIPLSLALSTQQQAQPSPMLLLATLPLPPQNAQSISLLDQLQDAQDVPSTCTHMYTHDMPKTRRIAVSSNYSKPAVSVTQTRRWTRSSHHFQISNSNEASSAIACFESTKERGIEPNVDTYNRLFAVFARDRSLDARDAIELTWRFFHAMSTDTAFHRPIQPNSHTASDILHVFAVHASLAHKEIRRVCVDHAHRFWHHYVLPSELHYSVRCFNELFIIMRFDEDKKFGDMWFYYEMMRKRGISPNAQTVQLMRQISRDNHADNKRIKKITNEFHLEQCTAMHTINFQLRKCENISQAMHIFETIETRGLSPNMDTFDRLFSILGRDSTPGLSAIGFAMELLQKIQPSAKHIEQCLRVFMHKCGFVDSRKACVARAHRFWHSYALPRKEQLKHRSFLVLFTIMQFDEEGIFGDMWKWYSVMKELNIRPRPVTFDAMLTICVTKNDEARTIDENIERIKQELDAFNLPLRDHTRLVLHLLTLQKM